MNQMDFHLVHNQKENSPYDQIPFYYEPNGFPFGSKSKGKLSPRSYPIQCERKWKHSSLSAGRKFASGICQQQRNPLLILVRLTKIRLYSTFSDWFWTEWNSVWFIYKYHSKKGKRNLISVNPAKIRSWFVCVCCSFVYHGYNFHEEKKNVSHER